MAKLLLFVIFLVGAVIADSNIYTDSVQSPFQDYSYASTRTASDSAQHHSGSDSYSFLPSDYQAVYFEDASAFDTSVYSGVQFWIYVPTNGNTNIEVDIIKSGNAVSPNKQLSTYLVGTSTITTNTWLQGFVNFSLFTAGQYDGVWWQDKSGKNATVRLYIDDVKLISKSSGSSAAATSASATTATTAKSATTAAASTASSTTAKAATTASVSSSSTTGSGTSTTGSSSGTGPSDSAVMAYYSSGISATKQTYYGTYTNGGECTLDPTPPVGTASGIYLTAALSTPEFKGSETCGICLNVTYLGTGDGTTPPPNNFVVFINNECPNCADGQIDLAESGSGIFDVSWKAIPCPTSSNIQYLFAGSNSYYIKIQARNTKYPVYQFAVKVGSSWQQLTRTSDNFFTAPSSFSGFPLVFPLSVQITAVNGEQVTDSVPSLVNSQVIQGSVQFA